MKREARLAICQPPWSGNFSAASHMISAVRRRPAYQDVAGRRIGLPFLAFGQHHAHALERGFAPCSLRSHIIAAGDEAARAFREMPLRIALDA